MVWKFSNKRKSQSLVELILSIALSIFFLSAFILNLSFITNKFSDYKDKNYAYQVLKKQKENNDRNLAYFLAQNKMVDNYSTDGHFAEQGRHLNYTFLNYETDNSTIFTNQEKKTFLDDEYIYYWSFDGVPSSSTYIVDDGGDSKRQGTISCIGPSCINPTPVEESKGECLANNCLRFESQTFDTAGTVSFPTLPTLDSKMESQTSWEAWIFDFVPADDHVFMSKGDNNFFGIINTYPTIQFEIGEVPVSVSGTDLNFIAPGQWYHLVGTYDGSNVKLYVNGVLVGQSEDVSGSINITGNLKFGYFNEFLLRSFAGYLDEVKIYDYALNSSEVLNRYNGFKRNIGLVAHWHLDDALNVATYNGASETGLNPYFKTFSSPDNIPITIEKAKAENNPLNCKSGACALFYRSYSSKGVLSDALNAYSQLHDFNQITISANIKIENATTGYQGIFGKDTSGNYALGLYDNDIQIALKIEGTRYTKTYDANLQEDTWYQIDATFDETNIKLYIDGVLKETWSQPGIMDNDSGYGDIYVAYSGTGNEYFDGYIDEIKVYNRALTLDDIVNQYKDGFTYYQYYKPVCRVSNDGVVSPECLNCNPTNSTECTRSVSGNNFEPLLSKSIYIVKYGAGLNYEQLKSEQVVPVINSFNQQEAGSNVWGGGYTAYSGSSCGRFVFDTYGESAGSSIKYNSSCGDPDCGRLIVGSEVCESNNISYFYDNGCSSCSGAVGTSNWSCTACESDGYFEKTSSGSSAYMISPTFNFPKKMGLTSFGWIGSGGPIKFQFACLDDIVDETGSEVPEASWTYLGPDTLNEKRCSDSSYYSANPNTPYSVSSCWETDNQSLYNCQFFRFKITIDSDITDAQINSIRLNFGQYPYTIIK